MTRNMTSNYQSSFTEKYKGLVGTKSHFPQNDCLTQWLNITQESTFWKLILAALQLPQQTIEHSQLQSHSPPCWFSQWTPRHPCPAPAAWGLSWHGTGTSRSQSALQNTPHCSTNIITPHTQPRWAMPWANLKILHHNQVNSLACLAPSTDFPFPKDMLQRNSL